MISYPYTISAEDQYPSRTAFHCSFEKNSKKFCNCDRIWQSPMLWLRCLWDENMGMIGVMGDCSGMAMKKSQ